MTAAVQRLNHAVLYVSDVERSVAFYRDKLGFTVAVPSALELHVTVAPPMRPRPATPRCRATTPW